MYLVRIGCPIFKTGWQGFINPIGAAAPLALGEGAKADSGITVDQKPELCFSKNNGHLNLISPEARLPLSVIPGVSSAELNNQLVHTGS